MNVEVVRRGGMVAISVRSIVDTADLPASAATAAEAALRSLDFSREPTPPPHPHSFRYEIALELDGKRRAVVLDEAEAPDALRPLIEAAMQQGTIAPA